MVRVNRNDLNRFEAAEELARAADVVRVLTQCERATGETFVTDADRDRVKVADTMWTWQR